MDGITNGFRIYSPDGAQWGVVTADTLNLGWEDMFDMWFDIHHYSTTGSDADTVGYIGISAYGDGLSSGYNEISYKITIGPIDDLYNGETICLDSSLFGFSGYWSWADSSGTEPPPN